MKRTIAIAVSAVALVAGCGSDSVKPWATPLNRTTCAQWVFDMQSSQRVAAAHALLAAVPTKSQSNASAHALAIYLKSQCETFPSQMVEDVAGIRTT